MRLTTQENGKFYMHCFCSQLAMGNYFHVIFIFPKGRKKDWWKYIAKLHSFIFLLFGCWQGKAPERVHLHYTLRNTKMFRGLFWWKQYILLHATLHLLSCHTCIRVTVLVRLSFFETICCMWHSINCIKISKLQTINNKNAKCISQHG